jgi:hypothetical protein
MSMRFVAGLMLAGMAVSAANAGEAPTGKRTGPLIMPDDVIVASPSSNAERQAYFGDMHVHTAYSFDAFAFGTLATPYDAYRYATGKTIEHSSGFKMKLRKPLDFYAVTDHAMFLGVSKVAADPESTFAEQGQVEYMRNLNAPEKMTPGGSPNRSQAFSTFLGDMLRGIADGSMDSDMVNNISRSAWADTIKAAEMYNKPGKFTTFVAYEYTTSSDDRGNLHRNVFFKDADKLPGMPFSRFHDQNPEGLWDWLDNLRDQGIEALAIPHNMNGSNGQMFKLVDWAGDPLDDEYNRKRLRNEPLIEITQIKGTSETHPALSMNDEWANFEIMPYRIATRLQSQPKGSYVREALLNGLAFQEKGMTNPFKFGFTGASDTHTAATAENEAEFYGKIGLLDANGSLKGSVALAPEVAARAKANNAPIQEFNGKVYRDGAQITWGAAGLSGVWAEENTREAIYSALRRKETFATTGPRMKVRLFAGYDYSDDVLDRRDALTHAYTDGVTMGSDLMPGEGSPQFIAWATRDAQSAPLQRLQIIKGWTLDGEHHEQVYDVACSNGQPVDPDTNRCPDNGASVDLSDCSTSGKGAGELKTVWTDPGFDPRHHAFYYARALENPTCRWSTWDAVQAGEPPREDYPKTIQERAWTSPIWYDPSLID